MKYWWIRIFDYKTDEELKEYTDIDVWEARRGTLLDEYYLCGEDMTREDAKKLLEKEAEWRGLQNQEKVVEYML